MIFKGESMESCLRMTKDQLYSMYWESFRQEARSNLNLLTLLVLARADYESRKQAIHDMELQAFPFDPEADPIFGREQMDQLRLAIMG